MNWILKKSSVSIAMKNLREGGKITVTQAGYIYLTDSGREIAEMIYERHQWLTNWLISLGVDSNIAAEDACKMEHVISKESFEALKNHFGQILIMKTRIIHTDRIKQFLHAFLFCFLFSSLLV